MAKFEIKDGVAIIPDGATEIQNMVFCDNNAIRQNIEFNSSCFD